MAAIPALFLFLLLAIYYFLFTTFLVNDIPFNGIFKKEAYKGIHAGRIIMGVFAGFALNIAVLGILFGVFGWTGIREMMLAALLQLLLLGIITIILQLIKPARYKKNILWRVATSMVVWLIVLWLNGGTLRL